MSDSAAQLRRKLTTIFCADVQGYSALVERDEVGTVTRLKQYREVMVAEIERHHGRAINTWGDGLLAEFSSPVEAVFCAVETQRRLKQFNADHPEQPPMLFRIGINLGDVMIDGDDIYGEGVNIAARLESLADPGGICISGTVYEQVRKKLDIGFAYIGERAMKNIAEPVTAYSIVFDETEASQPAPAEELLQSTPSATPNANAAWAAWQRRAWQYGAIAVFLVIINLLTSPGTFWFVWPALGMGLALAWQWIVTVKFPNPHRRNRYHHH